VRSGSRRAGCISSPAVPYPGRDRKMLRSREPRRSASSHCALQNAISPYVLEASDRRMHGVSGASQGTCFTRLIASGTDMIPDRTNSSVTGDCRTNGLQKHAWNRTVAHRETYYCGWGPGDTCPQPRWRRGSLADRMVPTTRFGRWSETSRPTLGELFRHRGASRGPDQGADYPMPLQFLCRRSTERDRWLR